MKTIFEQYNIAQEIPLYKNMYFLFCDLFEIYIDSFGQIEEALVAKGYGKEKDKFKILIENAGINNSLREQIKSLRNDIEHNEFHKYLEKDALSQSTKLLGELCEQLGFKMIQNEFLQRIKSRFEREKFIKVAGDKKKIRHWNDETRTLYKEEKKIRNPLEKYIRHLYKAVFLEKVKIRV